MNKAGERLYNGIIKENPTFILMLGMCPTLAVTTSAMNGLGMGLTTAVVLALSNVIISLLRGVIPNRVRIPAFIVIIASFVTVVELLLKAYLPSLNNALGVYIPLIVVNCIILGRAESYAYSNLVIPSLFDGIGMGLGFTVALTCIGGVRELLGAGKIFDYQIMPASYTPIGIFVLAPGAFFVLAALTAFQNYLKITGERVGKDVSKIQSGCNEDCMNCADSGCSKRFYDESAQKKQEPVMEAAKESAKVVEKAEEKATETTGKADTPAENVTDETAKSVAEKAEEPETVKTQKKSKTTVNTEEATTKEAEAPKPKRKRTTKKKEVAVEEKITEETSEKAQDDLEIVDLDKEEK